MGRCPVRGKEGGGEDNYRTTSLSGGAPQCTGHPSPQAHAKKLQRSVALHWTSVNLAVRILWADDKTPAHHASGVDASGWARQRASQGSCRRATHPHTAAPPALLPSRPPPHTQRPSTPHRHHPTRWCHPCDSQPVGWEASLGRKPYTRSRTSPSNAPVLSAQHHGRKTGVRGRGGRAYRGWGGGCTGRRE